VAGSGVNPGKPGAGAPAAVIAVCCLWLLASGAETWLLLSRGGASPVQLAYFLALQAGAAVGVVLIWRMRVPGLWIFAGVFALTQAVLLVQGHWSVDTLLLPVLVLAVAGAHLGRMR